VDCEELLELWFGRDLESPAIVEGLISKWFRGDSQLDRELARRFSSLPERARDGKLEGWGDDPRSALALVIVLDQLPRNLFRGSPRAYEFDAIALKAALAAIARGFDSQLHVLEASFLYLPLEHAEELAQQERGVEHFTRLAERAPPATRHCFEGFLEYACSHRDVIREFGRFPHRNAVLGRAPMPEERAYLAGGGATFGADSGLEDSE
jgi:uncharacterized protein (DUF924 family)